MELSLCREVDIPNHAQDNAGMVTEVDNNDLRILSLLHSLRDREEFIREAVRLLIANGISAVVWQQVCSLGNDLAPGHPLFDQEKSLDQLRQEYRAHAHGGGRRIIFDRRQKERRTAQRRRVPERRTDDRRAVALPRLGGERRAGERRKTWRREEDQYI